MKIRRQIKIYAPPAFLVILILGVIGWFAPIPASTPRFFASPPPSNILAPPLNWPPGGQAALGVKGAGVLDSYGQQNSVPTASVAKVFTALAVLKQKPLSPGQSGPLIAISQADLDSYESYYAAGGSLAPVALGEQLSERQALEAMLLPSANNMADTLARWAFGSIDNYLAYINQFNAKFGLKQTHIADASGFSASTVSSAENLVKIGQLVLADPVLASIVNEQQATIPVAGAVHNTNWLLGFNGINGINTGNTDQAGVCYIFSTDQQVVGRKLTIVGAVM
jgi:D-alanyl-D-alanine carboxypeptidase (penicillin-binding protein 5/6)